MTPTLSNLEKKLLVSIKSEIDQLKALPIMATVENNIDASHRADRQNARKNLLRLNLRLWLGDGTEAELKAGQRALLKLHDARLIRRYACGPGGSRATDVHLTRAGNALAKQLQHQASPAGNSAGKTRAGRTGSLPTEPGAQLSQGNHADH